MKNRMNILKFSLIAILSLLFANVSFSQSDTLRKPPNKGIIKADSTGKYMTYEDLNEGDSVLYPTPEIPLSIVSMSAMSYGDKIRHYCVMNNCNIDCFISICEEKLKAKQSQGKIVINPNDTKCLTDVFVWEVIREKSTPEGNIRIVFDEVFRENKQRVSGIERVEEKPAEAKEKGKPKGLTKMDF